MPGLLFLVQVSHLCSEERYFEMRTACRLLALVHVLWLKVMLHGAIFDAL